LVVTALKNPVNVERMPSSAVCCAVWAGITVVTELPLELLPFVVVEATVIVLAPAFHVTVDVWVMPPAVDAGAVGEEGVRNQVVLKRIDVRVDEPQLCEGGDRVEDKLHVGGARSGHGGGIRECGIDVFPLHVIPGANNQV
jgi:hypothetical protein